jgi:threonine dehydrogenase-like Zn-dependent dehydrogenase
MADLIDVNYGAHMKAVVYRGRTKVSVDEMPEPVIEDPTDVILKVTSAAICGSDLHLFGGYIPGMENGDIMGHEFMGEVVAAGSDVTNVAVGDRVVVPFNIACGECYFCKRELYSACDRSNRNGGISEKVYGQPLAGLFAYSHLTGGYPGGQAEFVRVPFANVGAFKVPDGLTDEQALFLGDIFPTGWMAAENANIHEGDTVAIWGAGPVGQMAIRSALLQGAGRVVAIDRLPERLAMAEAAGADTINFEVNDDVTQTLKDATDGRGPDSAIDAVGLEAHPEGLSGVYDKAKHMVRLETDRPTALRQIIQTVRKGGTVSVPGVYGGFIDKYPMGAFMNKGLTMHAGQTHTHKYVKPLMKMIEEGKIDPSFVITHRLPLDEAPEAYDMFREKRDGCIKVVLKP